MGFLNSLFGGLGKMAMGAGKSAGGFLQSAGKMLPQATQALNMFNPSGSSGMGGGPLKPGGPGGPQPPAMYKSSSPMGYGQLSKQSLVGSPYQVNSPASVGPGAIKKGGNLVDQIFGKDANPAYQTLAGLGVQGAGELFAPKSPKIPNFSDLPSAKALQSFKPTEFKPLDPNTEASINRGLDINEEQEMRNLRNVYQNARPGTDYTTDSAYQRDLANLQRSQGLRRADAMSSANNDWIKTQIGANEQEMQKLQELAQMDVFTIAAQLGLSSQEAEQFKQTFSNLGSMLMQKGLGFGGSGSSILDKFLQAA